MKNLKDEDYINNNYIVLATKQGIIKKTSLEAYSRPRTNGVIAITVREGDELLEAVMATAKSSLQDARDAAAASMRLMQEPLVERLPEFAA